MPMARRRMRRTAAVVGGAAVVAHGATLVADHRGIHGPGSGWVILADPEGNEFCVLRSEGELAAS